ncbi:hypothetical protein [Sphaerisporangium rubeum]|uniref:Uncharacterized protein n=1 Tax=Sphaerisporangium rubeum TaxID=321317 RepID=A0A7X0IDB1_9ACTN|nr:hypothetical protein [Sphaerisporangium rubeum]MBB6473160.1 hypothetical protein [Sphaerisporangium rubeum]
MTMAKSDTIKREARMAELPLLDRAKAAWNGRRDGRLTVPYGDPPVTGYLKYLEGRAHRASKQLQAGLRRRGRREVVIIHGLAQVVVHAHLNRGALTEGERGRFGQAYAAWVFQVEEYRRRAEAITDYLNELRNYYWMHLTRVREAAAKDGAVPVPLTPDPIWDKSDVLLFLRTDATDDPESARQIRVITKALELLTDL